MAGARSADRRRRAASHGCARRGAAHRHAGPPLVDHDGRGLVIPHVALFPHDRRRGLVIDVTACLLATDDDILAGTGASYAHRGAAAAVNRHARATRALTHRRAARALRLGPGRRRAAGDILFRGVAALPLAGTALLVHTGAALLRRAGARPRLRAGILRLRASWRPPVAGSAATGAATASTAAAPNIIASIRIFFSWGASPQDNPAVDVGFPRVAKIIDERMFILWASDALRPVDRQDARFDRGLVFRFT